MKTIEAVLYTNSLRISSTPFYDHSHDLSINLDAAVSHRLQCRGKQDGRMKPDKREQELTNMRGISSLRSLVTNASRTLLLLLLFVLASQAQPGSAPKKARTGPASTEQRTARYFESIRKSPPQRIGFPAQDAEGRRSAQSPFRRDLCRVLHPVGGGQWLVHQHHDDGLVSADAAGQMRSQTQNSRRRARHSRIPVSTAR